MLRRGDYVRIKSVPDDWSACWTVGELAKVLSVGPHMSKVESLSTKFSMHLLNVRMKKLRDDEKAMAILGGVTAHSLEPGT